MAGVLFEDIFDVKDIDPEGKKFDRVSRQGYHFSCNNKTCHVDEILNYSRLKCHFIIRIFLSITKGCTANLNHSKWSSYLTSIVGCIPWNQGTNFGWFQLLPSEKMDFQIQVRNIYLYCVYMSIYVILNKRKCAIEYS